MLLINNIKLILLLDFRDVKGNNAWYEPISLIEHRGSVGSTGVSHGHYVCDIKDKSTNNWFRTNDDKLPIQIESKDVSNQPYVILLRKIDYK